MINFGNFDRLSDYHFELSIDRACKKIDVRSVADTYWAIRQVPEPEKAAKFLEKNGLKVSHMSLNRDTSYRMVAMGRRVVINLEARPSYASLVVYAKGAESCRGTIQELDKFFKGYLVESKDKRIIPVDFWHWNGRNSAMITRLIECPTWDEISTNYVKQTAVEMAPVMDAKVPEETGKVMLWHGLPGTGKTYAVRALLQAWKEGYRPAVIVDPEVLFTNSSYLYDVLFDERHLHEDLEDAENNAKKKMQGKILVMEDMPDLLLKASRNDKNHAMARLLNLSDGILGQGIKAVYLFTTNQELDEIDPAFTRPGRCLATVRFEKFEPKEAMEWIRAKGAVIQDGDALSPMTIAEMYALLHKKSPLGSSKDLEPKKIVGFAVN